MKEYLTAIATFFSMVWQGLKDLGKALKQVFTQDNGQISSIRIIMFLVFVLWVWLLREFSIAFHLEILKEKPDYMGLTALFTAQFINMGVVVFLKVFQKKYEKNEN